MLVKVLEALVVAGVTTVDIKGVIMITKIGSVAWAAKAYKINSGGIDYKALREMKPELRSVGRIANPAVEVSISSEAKRMFQEMQEEMQRNNINTLKD